MAQRTVIITGGASGIGRGMAACFAKLGDRVIIGDIDSEAGTATSKALNVDFYQTDVRKYEDVSALIRHGTTFGPIHVVIANAGWNDGLGTERTSPEEWERSLAINLTSVYYTCRASLPHLAEKGRIIVTSSLVGLIGQRNSAGYAAAKGGLVSYVKALALELAPRKITMNAIAPGDVETPAYDRWLKTQPEGTLQNIMAHIPLGRFARPEEIGAVALFLASPEAGFITGQTIVIDGGKSLGQ